MADPGFLTVAGDDYAQTTDKAQLDVTGDLDLAILVEPAPGWNATEVERALAAKRTNASHFERAWDFYYFNQGGGSNVLRFEWKDGGGSEHTTTSTASLGSVASGDHMWLRVTLDVDDGSSQHVVTFYYSNDPIDTPIGSVSWTQLGSPVVTAGTTTIANSPHNLRVGLANVNAYDGFDGKIYGFWMRNGIGGTLVAAPDWRTSDQDWGNPPTADGVGNDWTFEGDAAWTPPTGADPQDLDGTALSVAPSFPGGQVSPGPVNLAGSVLAATTTFPAGDVTTSVEVVGQLLSAPTSFPGGAIDQALTLHGTLLEVDPAFPGGTVSPGPVTLTGSALGVSPVFPGGAVSPGAVTLSGTPLTAGVGFPGGRVRRVVVHPDGPATVTVDPIPPAEVALDILVGTAEYA